MDGGDGAHAAMVPRKKRQRGEKGVVEVTAWVCRGSRGCAGCTCLWTQLSLGEIPMRRNAGSTGARAMAASACVIAGPP